LFSSYSLSAIVGPGNEHVIARHLLVEALKKRNKHQINRAIQLGLGLCGRLLGADRFRDACIACGAMVHLLKDTGFKIESAHAARLNAQALRMMDRYEEAVEMVTKLLPEIHELTGRFAEVLDGELKAKFRPYLQLHDDKGVFGRLKTSADRLMISAETKLKSRYDA